MNKKREKIIRLDIVKKNSRKLLVRINENWAIVIFNIPDEKIRMSKSDHLFFVLLVFHTNAQEKPKTTYLLEILKALSR